MTVPKRVSDREVLQTLEWMVEAYRRTTQEAAEHVRNAEDAKKVHEKRLEDAERLLEYERQRVGLPSGATDSPYSGMALRDAAILVLKAADGDVVSASDLATTLIEGGFIFDSPSTGRALHGALMRAGDVDKPERGWYRLRSEYAHNRPVEDGRGSAQQG